MSKSSGNARRGRQRTSDDSVSDFQRFVDVLMLRRGNAKGDRFNRR